MALNHSVMLVRFTQNIFGIEINTKTTMIEEWPQNYSNIYR